MNDETKQKMFTIITENKSKKKRIMKIVHLTDVQMKKLFPTEVIKVLSHDRYLFLPVDGQVGKFTIERMKIGDTYCLVVKLSLRRFNNLFSETTYQVFTRTGESKKENVSCFRENPKQVHQSIPNPKMVVVHSSSTNQPTKTKIIPFPTYMVFSHDYSTIIRFNRFNNPTILFYLSNVG